MDSIDEKLNGLKAYISSLDDFALAFSGGIDSSLILRVARDATKCRAIPIMVVTEVISDREIQLADEIARTLGFTLMKVELDLLRIQSFRVNPRDRCYFCKRAMFELLSKVAEEQGLDMLLDGTNADDLDEHRPGNRVLIELGVRSPLAELNISKEEVREMARRLGMSISERPENTCLATRIPYGQEIDERRVARIEGGEDLLHALGLRELRVRDHGGIARIEVPIRDIGVILQHREEISSRFKELGFSFITLDLDGFRSGSMDMGQSHGGLGEMGPCD